MKSFSPPSKRMLTIMGACATATIWEIATRTYIVTIVPPISAMVEAISISPDASKFWTALRFTGVNAAYGYALGVLIGLLLAVLSTLVPILRPGAVRFAAISNATPVVALGPVLLATVQRDSLPIAVAAFFVFFTVFIATLAGLGDARAVHHDLYSALGSSRLRRFIFLELPSCVPKLLSGLKVAAPAAVVGSLFGEWFGLDQGIGPLLISSMQNYDQTSLWAGTLLSGALGAGAYCLLSLAEHRARQYFI